MRRPNEWCSPSACVHIARDTDRTCHSHIRNANAYDTSDELKIFTEILTVYDGCYVRFGPYLLRLYCVCFFLRRLLTLFFSRLPPFEIPLEAIVAVV